MLLTPELISYLAQKAQWYVEFDFNNITADNQGDPFVITGDGVEDLNQLLSRIDSNPGCSMTIDVGRQYSSFKPCDRSDIVAIREAYEGFYGHVNKPGRGIREAVAMKMNQNQPL